LLLTASFRKISASVSDAAILSCVTTPSGDSEEADNPRTSVNSEMSGINPLSSAHLRSSHKEFIPEESAGSTSIGWLQRVSSEVTPRDATGNEGSVTYEAEDRTTP